MGEVESESSEKIVDYGNNVTVTYNVCYYCREFPTPECLDLWKSILVQWAVLGYCVRLDKITYIPPDAHIDYTVMYIDGGNPRSGWVA